MKKISDFIVSKRYWILGVMLCLTIVCMVMSRNVSVNTDMTKYLPDDSSMKMGVDIMEEEFPAMEIANGIRVMAEGLNEEQKRELLTELEELPYVDSVAHDDSEDYNKETYSLFVISTSYDYGSDEELAIENALENDFSEYNIVFKNNDSDFEGLTPALIATAMTILLTILFIMSESWFEPILFLLTIGIAVVINSGTNIFLGEVSDITSSISAILQLVLSMDYSIILINRYRQEKALGLENKEAMTSALQYSISSIVSSSMTTVVGLLALVFMNFKIGKDLGIVLGKGVFLSMVCVVTVLPCLILLSDKILVKTAKKSIHIPMGAVARFSYRFRYPLILLFIVMFVGFNALQGNTQISYNLANEDPIADVFPSDNMLVMIYDNEDEEKVANLADALENYDGVKQVLGYPNLLGKAYTSTEFSDMLGDLGSSMGVELEEEMSLDPALLDLIYYHYYDGKTYPIKMEDFLTFLSEEVLNNDTFADAIEDDMREQADRLADFADAENLTSAKSIQGLAEFFDMDEETIKSLLLYYYTQHGGADLGTMTLPTFASFVVDEVAADSTYSAMFDSDALAKMQQLKTFTNTYNITTPFSYTKIANLLGIDAETVEMLFVYYYAMSDSYKPGKMTLPTFVSFLQNDVMKNPTFATYLDESVSSQINTLAQFTNKTTLQKQYTSAELAKMLGMDESMVAMLFTLHNVQDVSGKTMTLAQFMGFLNDNILSNEMYAESFDDATKAQLQSMNSMVQLAASGQTLTPAQMAGVIGMDEATMTQLYFLYLSTNDTSFQQEMVSMTMALEDFVTLAKSQAAGEQLTQLNQMEQIIKVSVSGEALSKEKLAGITGMGEEDIAAMFAASGAESMTLQKFLTVALSVQSSNAKLQQLSQIVNLAASGKKVDAATLAQIFSMETTKVQQLFGLNLAAQKSISLPVFTNFLVNTVLNNEAYAGNFSEEQKTQLTTLNQMIQLAASGKGLDTATLAQTFGMDESLITMIFRLYYGGDTSGKTMSMVGIVNFILKDSAMSALLDSETMIQLKTMQGLMNATIKGTWFSYSKLASMLGMDKSMLKMLFTYHDASTGKSDGWRLSLQTVVNFLVNNKSTFASMMGSDTMSQLSMMQGLMNGTIEGTSYKPSALADLLGMDSSQIEQLYLLYISQHGDTSSWKMSVQKMVNFLNSDVLNNEEFADMLDADSKEMLTGAKTMIDAVVSGKEYTASETQRILSALTDELDANTVELLYFYYAAQQNSDSSWKLSIEQLLDHLCDSVMEDDRFASFIDDEMRSQITDVQGTLNDGVGMLKSENHSRMIIYTTLPVESEETTDLISWLNEQCSDFSGQINLIGNSAMSYEMQQTFDDELTMITMLTSVAIFLIVLVTFRNFLVPLLLVLVVQCGVYVTVAIIGFQGYSIYFLALLIVECILMGATIDYGILFTNYFIENCKMMETKDAIQEAYKGSIHTIMTSGLIIVLVVGIVGYSAVDPTIGQICRTIAIGALSAILLILFVLPGMLAGFKRLIVRKKNSDKAKC